MGALPPLPTSVLSAHMVHTGRGTVAVDPDSVAGARFAQSFRGYAPHEVQAFLLAVSDELRSLRARTEDAEERAAALDAQPVSLPTSVGEEAGRVLTAAEEAATEIRGRAEDAVAKMLRDAQDEVTAERSRAQQERSDIVAAAEAEAARIRELADAERDTAREEGRAMVAEAREVRERVLANLADKRLLARRELAQLKAGIDELRRSYAALEELLAVSIGTVDAAIPNARAAALAAASQVADEGRQGHYAAPGTPQIEEVEEQPASLEVAAESLLDGVDGETDEVVERLEATLEQLDRMGEEPPADGAPVSVRPESSASEVLPPSTVTSEEMVGDGQPEFPEAASPEGVSEHDPADEVEEAAVIDLEARRLTVGSVLAGSGSTPSPFDTDELDLTALEEELELDPVLSGTDAIEERRQAERRQLFGARAGAARGDDPAIGTADFGPADEPVPLVSAREASRVDDLFARIRESRAGAVAQAREVLSRTTELPVVEVASSARTAAPDGPGASGDEPDGLTVERTVALIDMPPAASHGLEERDAAIDELGSDAALALKRCLADQLNEVLDVLRRTPEGVDDVAVLVPEAADRAFGAAMKAHLLSAGRRGSLTGDVDVTAVVRAVGSDVGASLRDRLAPYLFEGDQLERRVRGVYREWRRERVDELARDALAAAYASGLFASIPDGTPVRWLVPDRGCCSAECHDNSLADGVMIGDPFPTGDLMAPAGPGCRSLVIPNGR